MEASVETAHAICPNCDHALDENDRFCSQCGQSTTSSQRPFWSAATQSLHELLDIDGRLFRSLKYLFIAPGKLTSEYIKGRRVSYTPALRLYLAVSILFFLAISAFPEMWDAQGKDALTLLEYVPKLMFLLFPLFALLTTALFPNSYLLSNLVFSMHMHTAAYCFLLIDMVVEHIEADIFKLDFPPLTNLLNAYMLWYLVKSFYVVFQKGWLRSVLFSFFIFTVYIALMVIALQIVLEVIGSNASQSVSLILQ